MFQHHTTSLEVKKLKWGSWKGRWNNFLWWCIEKVAGYFLCICWLICKSFEIEKWFNAHSYLRLAGHHNNVAHFILSTAFLGQTSRRKRGAQRMLRTIPSGKTTKYFNSLHSQQNSFVIDSRGKAQYNWPLGFLHQWSLSLSTKLNSFLHQCPCPPVNIRLDHSINKTLFY